MSVRYVVTLFGSIVCSIAIGASFCISLATAAEVGQKKNPYLLSQRCTAVAMGVMAKQYAPLRQAERQQIVALVRKQCDLMLSLKSASDDEAISDITWHVAELRLQIWKVLAGEHSEHYVKLLQELDSAFADAYSENVALETTLRPYVNVEPNNWNRDFAKACPEQLVQAASVKDLLVMSLEGFDSLNGELISSFNTAMTDSIAQARRTGIVEEARAYNVISQIQINTKALREARLAMETNMEHILAYRAGADCPTVGTFD